MCNETELSIRSTTLITLTTQNKEVAATCEASSLWSKQALMDSGGWENPEKSVETWRHGPHIDPPQIFHRVYYLHVRLPQRFTSGQTMWEWHSRKDPSLKFPERIIGNPHKSPLGSCLHLMLLDHLTSHSIHRNVLDSKSGRTMIGACIGSRIVWDSKSQESTPWPWRWPHIIEDLLWLCNRGICFVPTQVSLAWTALSFGVMIHTVL